MCFCKIPISRGKRLYSSEYSEPGYRRSVSKWLFIIFEILLCTLETLSLWIFIKI
nr:MAG TPA: hypothetical protein [Caudoviricetes sp.]